MTSKSGIAFAVDDVTPATTPLAERRAHEAVRELLGGLESCSDYHGTVVADVAYQPLLAAVYLAFKGHRPLVLTPDAVWLTIAQGVAHHMAVHGERLRSRFVSHVGRLDLNFECEGWIDGTPENPWIEAFASWSAQIREHVGPTLHDALACDFSTSGPVERAAGQVVMMDVFERYFHYVAVCICGIPSVTLEGATADWERLAAKVDTLGDFDLEWWLAHLRPICAQFVRASRGDVDVAHWQAICKRREAYGGDVVNGWIAKLFPYLRAFYNGPCTRRNPVFETGEGFQTMHAPTGLSRVPFTFCNGPRTRAMEAVGGLFGVTQDPATLALRPRVGWAVREADVLDAALRRLAAEHRVVAGVIDPPTDPQSESPLPEDLAAFYRRTNGAELHVGAEAPWCRIVPRAEVRPLDSANDDGWHRLAWFADGSWLAINLDWNAPDPRPLGEFDPQESLHAICYGRGEGTVRPGRCVIVGHSFAAVLRRLVDEGPSIEWSESARGDAWKYTRKRSAPSV